MLFWAAIVLIGIAVFIVTNTIFQDEEQFKAAEKLEDTVSKDQIAKHGFVLIVSRPFFKRYISPVVASLKAKRKIKERYKRKLASAGLTEVLTTEDFYSYKLFMIVAFPIVYLVLKYFMEWDYPVWIAPLTGVIGYFYPDFWVSGKAQKRRDEVIIAMPFCVDMLALSVEAGLDFIAAMQKVIEKARPSALTEEFNTVIKEIRVGASRAEALRAMSWRLDMIQMSSFTATLIAADSVGASIGPILKSLSAEIRQKKSSDAEKKGATAATKILFPLLFLIAPAVFIMVAAPIVLDFITGGVR